MAAACNRISSDGSMADEDDGLLEAVQGLQLGRPDGDDGDVPLRAGDVPNRPRCEGAD